MADIRIVTGVASPTRITNDGAFMAVRGLRDGSLISAPWLESLMLEGRCYTVSAGSQTSPLTAVAYDQDQPEITLGVPSGTAIYVYSVDIVLEAFTGTNTEVICWMTDNEIGAGTSTAMTEGPNSLRSSDPMTSNVTARVLHTANVTLTNYREIWRGVQATAEAAGVDANFHWPLAGDVGPLIVGAGSFGVQIAATTTQPTFYAKIHYAELPSTQF